MLLKIFNFLDENVLSAYQKIVNLSNKITGSGGEHLRLAKISRYTDAALALIIGVLLSKMVGLVDPALRLNQSMNSAAKPPVVLNTNDGIILLLAWICSTVVLKFSKAIKPGQALLANPIAYYYRRLILASLVVLIFFSLILTLYLPSSSRGEILLVLFLHITKGCFMVMISVYYFLSCVPPPAQKSLFVHLKEKFAAESKLKPVPIPIKP